MDESLTRLVEVVHRRDALVAERQKLTEGLDARIEEVERELRSMMIGPPVASAGGAPARTEVLDASAPGVAPGSIREKILDTLRAEPNLKHGALVVKIYDVDTLQTRDRLRAQIQGLKKRGLLKRRKGSKALWEVVPRTAQHETQPSGLNGGVVH